MINNCLLIRKRYINIREARGIARNYKKSKGLKMNCKIIKIDKRCPSLYYCFGKIPNNEQRDDIDTNGFFHDIFFFEDI